MRNILLVAVFIILLPLISAAQGNAFSFQGRLNDGANPANGSYDLQFGLFTSIAGGTQIGMTVARPNTTLINGVFSVTLDFGATAFNNPNAVFIEIGVKPNGSPNAFTILGPRQQLTIVPFAVRASNATNSNTLNGLNSTDFIRNSEVPVANQNFNIVGKGVINGSLRIFGTGAGGLISLQADDAYFSQSLQVNQDALVSGNLTAGGRIRASGNVEQDVNSNGVVKAMAVIRVTRTGFPNVPTATATVVRCFSSFALPSVPNCGITFGTIAIDDSVQINFAFPVIGRFVSVTGINDTVSFLAFPNSTTVEIDDTTTNGGSSEFFVYIFWLDLFR